MGGEHIHASTNVSTHTHTHTLPPSLPAFLPPRSPLATVPSSHGLRGEGGSGGGVTPEAGAMRRGGRDRDRDTGGRSPKMGAGGGSRGQGEVLGGRAGRRRDGPVRPQ